MDTPTTEDEPLVRWCVRHRDGWCRVKGGRRPKENADNVPTHCGYVVTLPWGIERRTPTCPECLQPDK